MLTKRENDWLTIQAKDDWIQKTIQEVLKEDLNMSKGILHRYLHDKAICVNETEVRPHLLSKQISKGDTLKLRTYGKEEMNLQPEEGTIHILYEDEHLLIVNKPVGLLVHPNEPNQKGTLSHYVAKYLQKQGIIQQVRHIHRLDQETSGAVLFAKHAIAQGLLDKALRNHLIKRDYVGFIEGRLEKKQGTINAPIGRDRHHPTRRRVSDRGENAVTHFQVLENYKDATMVKFSLETGKTHQIRVHMSNINHPLLGDDLYFGSRALIKRQALHGASLSFFHPFHEEWLTIDAPMPKDMEKLHEILKLSKIQ